VLLDEFTHTCQNHQQINPNKIPTTTTTRHCGRRNQHHCYNNRSNSRSKRHVDTSILVCIDNSRRVVLREEPATKKQMQDGTEMVQVGAFPFPTGTDPLTAFNARVVDEETSSLPLVGGPIIEAMPLEESEQREPQVLHAVLKSRKCRIRILAMTVILIVGLIVAVVLVTQNSSKALPSSASPQVPNTVPPGFETSTLAPSPPRLHRLD
jgi:hypothetical protein